MEKIPRVKEDEEKGSDSAGRPGITFGPPPRRGTLQRWAERRDALPGAENKSCQSERTGVDDVGFLVENHPGEAEHGGPETGAVAFQPQCDRSPGEKHGEEGEPRFVDRITSVEDFSGGKGKSQSRPAHRGSSEPAREKKENRNGEQAGQHRGQAQCPEVASEQFLRDKDGVKMPRPVEIGRIIGEVPRVTQAVGEPTVDAFVEMRRFEVQQNEAEDRGQSHDGDEIPRKAAQCRGQGHGELRP